MALLIEQLVASSSVVRQKRRFVLGPFGGLSSVVEVEAGELDLGDAKVACELRVLNVFEFRNGSGEWLVAR